MDFILFSFGGFIMKKTIILTILFAITALSGNFAFASGSLGLEEPLISQPVPPLMAPLTDFDADDKPVYYIDIDDNAGQGGPTVDLLKTFIPGAGNRLSLEPPKEFKLDPDASGNSDNKDPVSKKTKKISFFSRPAVRASAVILASVIGAKVFWNYFIR